MYSAKQGMWQFKVKHFTKYGLKDDFADMEDDNFA